MSEDKNVKQVWPTDNSLVFGVFGFFMILACFVFWRLWIPKDDGAYVLAIVVAYAITKLVLQIVFFIKSRGTAQMVELPILPVVGLQTIGTLIVFAAIRILAPHDIATKMEIMIPIFLVCLFAGKVLKFIPTKAKD